MATEVSATEIRNRAAWALGVKAVNVTLDAAIAADLDNAYLEMYAELEGDQLTRWASTQDVPNKYVRAMVTLVAWARINEYPLDQDRYDRLIRAAGPEGERAKDRKRDADVKAWSDEEIEGNYW